MTLNDIATRLGVETRELRGGWPRGDEPQRHALDIAHECLAKLPVGRFTVEWTQFGNDPQVWAAYDFYEKQRGEDFHQPMFTGTFEQAVVALAERYLETKP